MRRLWEKRRGGVGGKKKRELISVDRVTGLRVVRAVRTGSELRQ